MVVMEREVRRVRVGLMAGTEEAILAEVDASLDARSDDETDEKSYGDDALDDRMDGRGATTSYELSPQTNR